MIDSPVLQCTASNLEFVDQEFHNHDQVVCVQHNKYSWRIHKTEDF